VRELKLVSAEGIRGGGIDSGFSAQRLAEAEDSIFRPETALTIMDFAQ